MSSSGAGSLFSTPPPGLLALPWVAASLWSVVALDLQLRARSGAAWAEEDRETGCACFTKVCRAVLAKDPSLCSKILHPSQDIRSGLLKMPDSVKANLQGNCWVSSLVVSGCDKVPL